MSRLDLGLQNSSAMARQTRGLPQLRIKFCATLATGLQIVLLLTVLPQGKIRRTHFADMLYGEPVRDVPCSRTLISFIVRLDRFDERKRHGRRFFERTTLKVSTGRRAASKPLPLPPPNSSSNEGRYAYRLRDMTLR